MKIQLIRNATLKVWYGEKVLLIDPMLCNKGAFDPFAGLARNPTIELPIDVSKITKDIDAVLVTHVHPDHFDPVAIEIIPKDTPLFYQPFDSESMAKTGFKNNTAIEENIQWNGITIVRTGGKHGTGPLLEQLGEVSGFVLKSETEPTLYIVGDSIWNQEVEEAIEKHQPDIIITNSGGALIPGFEDAPILMTEKQTIELANKASKAKIIAVHMEALDHCMTTRTSLRTYADLQNIHSDRLLIPTDGEIIHLN